MIEHAEPLGLGPVLRVDTSEIVDLASVAKWCHEHAWTTEAADTIEAVGIPSCGTRHASTPPTDNDAQNLEPQRPSRVRVRPKCGAR